MKAHSLNGIRLYTLLSCCACLPALAGNTWDGGGGNNLWSNSLNWTSDTLPGYGTLVFDGAVQTTNVIDSVVSMNQVNWNGAMPWVLNSSGAGHLMLYDNGGTQAKLENFGSVAVTINAPITFAATSGANFGEINAVTGSMNFTGGTLTVNGSVVNGIKFWGGGGNDVSFANTVNASGKWFGFTSTNSQSVTIASGANVTTGDWYVMNGGTLKLAGGTLTTSAIRLGGDFGTTGNQNQTLGGTLALTAPTGGINFSGPINAVSGNTSNALLISSQNATGTNTLTGGIFLDSDLKIQQMPGAALTTSTGTFDVKAQKLTVEAGAMSTVTISQALTSSLAAGGSLVKEGNGTLVLSSTSNNYTGTSTGSLNANGTQILSGTLAIAGDGSLGLVPSSAYNNVQFTGSGTLRADATMTLNANRNISIASSQTATFDNNGNSFRVNGGISGSGSLASAGGGKTTLAGTNTYAGTTTVSSGTLFFTRQTALYNNTPASWTASNIVVESGATLAFSVGGTNEFTATNLNTLKALGTAAGGLKNGAILGLDTTNASGGIFTPTSAIANTNSGANVIGLTKLGTGMLNLTAANTYTGTTTISEGTLLLSSSGSLSPSSAIVNNATIQFNRTATMTQGVDFGTMSGSGLLRKGSDSTLVLNALNSYSGQTFIHSGVISFNSIENADGTASALGAPSTLENGTIGLGSGDLDPITRKLLYTGTGNTSNRIINLNGDNLAIEQGGTGLLKFTSGLTSTFNAAKTLTIEGSASGVGELAGGVVDFSGASPTSLTKSGTGRWVLSGESSYTGTTSVQQGVLEATVNNALGTTDGGTQVAIGATLRLASVSYTTAETLTMNGGTLASTGTSSFAGPVTMTDGGISTAAGSTLTLSGGISLTAASNFNKEGSGELTITGTGISRATPFLLAVNSGTLVLGAANTDMSVVQVAFGSTLKLDHAAAIPNTPQMQISGGGVLDLGGQSISMQLSGGSSGTITNSQAATLSTATLASSGYFNGSINDGAGAVAVVATGGSPVLAGSSNYSGTTTVSTATVLSLQNNGALGSSAGGTTVQDGGRIHFTGGVSYNMAEAFTINGSGASGQGALSFHFGTSTLSGPISAATNAMIRVDGSSTLNLNGGLVKDGTTLTLAGTGASSVFNINTVGISGSSPYPGLVVDSSTVNLNVASTLEGHITVINGGTLNANVTGALPASPRAYMALDNNNANGASTLALGASQALAHLETALSSTVDLGAHTLTIGSGAPPSGSITMSGTITGTGNLVKDGTSRQRIEGVNNTYTGTTTIAGGELLIFGDESLGAVPGAPENKLFFTGNGTLWSDASSFTLHANRGISISSGVTGTLSNGGSTFTINGAISGDGNLASAGLGTTVLNGSNTYSGTTTVNAGVLSIGSGSTSGNLGAGDVVIGSGAELRFNRSNAYEASNAISGAGDLRQSGSGTTTLSGSNSYAGTTFVSGGTLEVQVNNALGTAAGGTQVASGATLRLDNVNYSTAEPLALSGTLHNLGNSTFAGPVQAAGVGIVELGFNPGYSLNLSGGVSVDAGSTLRVGGLGQATIGGGGLSGGATATVQVIDFQTRLVLAAPSAFGGTFNFGGTTNATTTIQLATANAFSGPDYPSFSSSNPVSGGVLDMNGYSATIAEMGYLFSVTNTQAATTSTLTLSGSSPYSELFLAAKDGAGVLAITRAGTGNVNMSGNTYSGLTTIQSGSITTLLNGLGSAAAGTVVQNGGALILFADTLYTTPESLTINGTGISNGGAFSSSGTSSFAGLITAASNATIKSSGTLTLTGGLVKDGTTLTLAGPGQFNINSIGISGSSANSDLVVDGATVVLNAINSYNGPTTVQNSGTLRLGISAAMPTAPHSALSLVSSGTFDLNGYSDTIAALNGTGSVINGGLGMAALTVGGSNGSGSFSGTLTGDISLNKTGSGLQTLSGASTYGSTAIAITTVTQGTLNATNASGSATGGSTVVIDPTGTLAGSGAIAPAAGKSVYINGTFIVGDATLGSPVASDFGITTSGGGTMSVGSTATLKFDLFTGASLGSNNATPTAADILALQGDASFATGSILEIGNPNAMSGWLVGDSWRIWDTTGAGTLSGVLAVVGPNLGGAGFWDFNMASGILSIVGVPEPSRAFLSLVGLLTIFSRRRRI